MAAAEPDPPPPPPSWRPTLVVCLLAVVLGGCFVASYSLALGRPQPRQIPTAVVGRPSAEAALVARVQRASGITFDLRPAATEDAARADIEHGRTYAALVVRGQGQVPRLLLASAAGSSVSRVLQQAVQETQAATGRRIDVVDVAPLPRSDPQGLIVFYVTLAATIVGFVTMFQLKAHAGRVSTRRWVGTLVAFAVVAGGVITAVSGPGIGALGGSFAEKWLIIATEVLIAGLVNSVLITLVGRWAILPVWTLFVLLGNTSSGGAVAPPLLPPVYAFLGRFLSPGATVDALRRAVYFPEAQLAGPFVVLACWVAGSALVLALVVRVMGRGPAG